MKKLLYFILATIILLSGRVALAATERPLLSTDDPLWLSAITAVAVQNSNLNYVEICDDKVYFQYSNHRLVSAYSLSGVNVIYNYSNDLLWSATIDSENIYFDYDDNGYLSEAYVFGGDRVEFGYFIDKLDNASIFFDDDQIQFIYSDDDKIVNYAGIMGGDRVFFSYNSSPSTLLCPTKPTRLSTKKIKGHDAIVKWEKSSNTDYYLYELTTIFQLSNDKKTKIVDYPVIQYKNRVKLNSAHIFPNTKYIFRVKACSSYSRSCSKWSPPKKFKTKS